MFCNKDHGTSDEFIVFGHNRQNVFVSEIENYKGLRQGFTPHLISWEKRPDGWYDVVVACGIVGCGCSIFNGELYIDHAETHKLSESGFNDLKNFKNTGYELN